METPKNILRAIAGESLARNKYTFFAAQAKKEGLEQIAAIFEETADNEKEHAKRLSKLLRGEESSNLAEFHFSPIDQTAGNLKIAAEGENYEHTTMYPQFAEIARKEGQTEAATVFKEISEVEEQHEKRYLKLKSNLDENRVFKREEAVLWRCRNCGYVHSDKEAPGICPACAHPQAYFELLAENY